MATVGLLGVSIVGNLTETSVVTQFHNEAGFVAAFVVGVIATTFSSNDEALNRASVIELNPGRFAMVVLTLLFAAELV